jgi:hypothetical protein
MVRIQNYLYIQLGIARDELNLLGFIYP